VRRRRPLRPWESAADGRPAARLRLGGGFLELVCHEFVELDAHEVELHRRPLELVRPARLGTSTVAVAVLARSADGRVLLGLDDDDLPAAQGFLGNSELLVAPAWRLPRDIVGAAAARRWVAARLAADYGLAAGESWELGGRYHPSPGITPEVVHPLAVELAALPSPAPRALRFVPLDEVVRERAALRDGHLRIVGLRAAHALGLFARPDPDGAVRATRA
jgi:hypothetical protein